MDSPCKPSRGKSLLSPESRDSLHVTQGPYAPLRQLSFYFIVCLGKWRTEKTGMTQS